MVKCVYRSNQAARPAAPAMGRPVILGAAPGASVTDETAEPAASVAEERALVASEAREEAPEAAEEAALEASEAAEELQSGQQKSTHGHWL